MIPLLAVLALAISVLAISKREDMSEFDNSLSLNVFSNFIV